MVIPAKLLGYVFKVGAIVSFIDENVLASDGIDALDVVIIFVVGLMDDDGLVSDGTADDEVVKEFVLDREKGSAVDEDMIVSGDAVIVDFAGVETAALFCVKFEATKKIKYLSKQLIIFETQ
uniref:Uncharacterized protein n=1 Tax=Acrobeloides nanus TaxID=290746 RepID=A0A914D8Y1_9BILA